jgi:hypothetical protein
VGYAGTMKIEVARPFYFFDVNLTFSSSDSHSALASPQS